MNLREIKALQKAKQFKLALTELDKLLKRHKECPHLWNLRGDLIQLLETQDGPPLADAAAGYKSALRLCPDDLEALESLAHFYDAVDPEPVKAKRFARAYIAKVRRGLREMERILEENS
jgi:hypothetical protein